MRGNETTVWQYPLPKWRYWANVWLLVIYQKRSFLKNITLACNLNNMGYKTELDAVVVSIWTNRFLIDFYNKGDISCVCLSEKCFFGIMLILGMNFFIDLHLLLCWYYVVAVCGCIGGVCYKNLKDGHDLCKNVVYSSGVVG